MNRLAASILGLATLALVGVGGVALVEYMTAGDDPWARLSIVVVVVAFGCAAFAGTAAYLVWRDSTSGWIGAAVLTLVAGVAWMDFGMSSSGAEVAVVLIPGLVIGAMAALTIARFRRHPFTQR